ncbi:hypothetical protein C2I36_00215 [Rhodobacteraceae bacterium WD3A24]|nr:hypothetical protein C2I36_00215 [Rhodobacteraceae bacterium WD3A24]
MPFFRQAGAPCSNDAMHLARLRQPLMAGFAKGRARGPRGATDPAVPFSRQYAPAWCRPLGAARLDGAAASA